MAADAKPQALDYLRAQPWPAGFKVGVLYGWGKVTGGLISTDDAVSVFASGVPAYEK